MKSIESKRRKGEFLREGRAWGAPVWVFPGPPLHRNGKSMTWVASFSSCQELVPSDFSFLVPSQKKKNLIEPNHTTKFMIYPLENSLMEQPNNSSKTQTEGPTKSMLFWN